MYTEIKITEKGLDFYWKKGASFKARAVPGGLGIFKKSQRVQFHAFCLRAVSFLTVEIEI